MKTLVVFSGKYGTTAMFAHRLAQAFGDESQSMDLADSNAIDWNHWDAVVIGGGIYIGKVRKEIKSFCRRFAQELEKRAIALFLCAGEKEPEQIRQLFEKNFHPALLETARVKMRFPGGQVLNEKAGFIYRNVFPKMPKATEEEMEDLVHSFVEQMNPSEESNE